MQALRPPILHGVRREGRGPLFAIRLRQNWPRVGAASPPKREPIVTPQFATYKGGKPTFHPSHTLSFPWPTLEAGSECEVAEIPVLRRFNWSRIQSDVNVLRC